MDFRKLKRRIFGWKKDGKGEQVCIDLECQGKCCKYHAPARTGVPVEWVDCKETGQCNKRKKTAPRLTDAEGNPITACTICGAEISPHRFREVETLWGVVYNVQILECQDCGTPSFGWWKDE